MSSIIEAALAKAAAQPPGPATVQLLTPQHAARWDAFVRAHPAATFFHLSAWQTLITRCYGHQTWFYFVEQDGQIQGVLGLCQIKSRLFGHSLSSLPFCVHGGVLALHDGARALLDEAASSLAGALGVGHLEYRNIAPTGKPGWQVKDLYVTFRKAISADHEENMNAIPRKQRAMVRKGIKCGLAAEIDQDVERFFHIYATSVLRLGTPVFPKKYFALIKELFGEQCEIRIIVKDGLPVAGVMSFYWRDEVLPYYGGSMPIAREVAGNDFMYWNLMEAAVERGCRLFDFGRSKLGTGAYDFKKNWGFTATPLAYEYQLHAATELPDNNPLNPKYQLFIKLWKRLPLPVANLLGPHIVKSLG